VNLKAQIELEFAIDEMIHMARISELLAHMAREGGELIDRDEAAELNMTITARLKDECEAVKRKALALRRSRTHARRVPVRTGEMAAMPATTREKLDGSVDQVVSG
jgi:hypothetical protein